MAEHKPHTFNRPRYDLGTIFAHGYFDLETLLALASQIRDNMPCTADKDKKPSTGGLNWVVFLTFSDGVEWAFRVPRQEWGVDLSDRALENQLASEVATMRYIKKNTAIPVPEVYSAATTSNNPIGVPYILMSKIPGHDLFFWKFNDIPSPPRKHDVLRETTAEQRHKLMFQLGAILSGLVGHRFDKIGSLVENGNGKDTPERPTVGECLVPAFFWETREKCTSVSHGPFTDEGQYLLAQIKALEEQRKSPDLPFDMAPLFIPNLDLRHMVYYSSERRWLAGLYHSALTDLKRETDYNSVELEYVIMEHIIENMVPRIVKAGEKTAEPGRADWMTAISSNGGDHTTTGSEADRFVLVHPDLHLGNVFVDDDFNITGILDWSATSTGSLEGLLASPMISMSPEEEPTLMAAYRDGFRKGYIEHAAADGGRVIYSSGYEFSKEQWKKAQMLDQLRWLTLMGTRWVWGYTHIRDLYKLVYGDDVDDEIKDPIIHKAVIEDSSHMTDDDTSSVHDTSSLADHIAVDDRNTTDDDTLSSDCTSNSSNGSDGSSTGCNEDCVVGCTCTTDSKEAAENRACNKDDAPKDFSYDIKMLDVFRRHRELPYAKAELARFIKEDVEASDDEEDDSGKGGGFSWTVAQKIVTMQSLNPNLVVDDRLWRWLTEALAERAEGIYPSYLEGCRKNREAHYKLMAEKKAEEEKKKAEEEKKKAEEATMETAEEEANSNSKEAAEVEETTLGLVEESPEVAAAVTESVEATD